MNEENESDLGVFFSVKGAAADCMVIYEFVAGSSVLRVCRHGL